VAIDIHLEAARAVGEEEMLAFFGRAADATLMDPDGSPYLRTPGMDITPFAIGPDDPDEYEYRITALGFRRRVLVIFRLRNLATEDETAEAERQIVTSALEFLSTYESDGVLLHYGEYVMLERRNGEVTIDSGLEAFMDNPLLTEALADYPHRKLRQPFQ
jgi:hypothetical protein